MISVINCSTDVCFFKYLSRILREISPAISLKFSNVILIHSPSLLFIKLYIEYFRTISKVPWSSSSGIFSKSSSRDKFFRKSSRFFFQKSSHWFPPLNNIKYSFRRSRRNSFTDSLKQFSWDCFGQKLEIFQFFFKNLANIDSKFQQGFL